jgi:serine/threonine protein kinase
MLDILNGFVELSKHDIIHRDLKPANILINGSTYKIAGTPTHHQIGLEFAKFAKCVDNLRNSMVQSAVETPLHMSP